MADLLSSASSATSLFTSYNVFSLLILIFPYSVFGKEKRDNISAISLDKSYIFNFFDYFSFIIFQSIFL